MTNEGRRGFWEEAFAIHGSITPHVVPHVLAFGFVAAAIGVVAWIADDKFGVRLGLQVAPYEIAGAALGLLLVLRTNAGYERWWEARKLWGGIVNQCRNLAISGLCYGPDRREWREQYVRWVAAFPHVARCSLRGERPSSEVVELLGGDATERIQEAAHMPSFVAMQIGNILREACEESKMDKFAFLQVDKERALLIDHIGACERILKTPLPLVYSIKIRRFIALFLLTLPFALLHRTNSSWLVPLITMFVAYPLISLDQIGIELQNPFAKSNLSHLPLDDISNTIERNVIGLLDANGTRSTRDEVQQAVLK
ncbi:MAG: bestrophin family protein [Planctomycetaceae bacterium]